MHTRRKNESGELAEEFEWAHAGVRGVAYSTVGEIGAMVWVRHRDHLVGAPAWVDATQQAGRAPLRHHVIDVVVRRGDWSLEIPLPVSR